MVSSVNHNISFSQQLFPREYNVVKNTVKKVIADYYQATSCDQANRTDLQAAATRAAEGAIRDYRKAKTDAKTRIVRVDRQTAALNAARKAVNEFFLKAPAPIAPIAAAPIAPIAAAPIAPIAAAPAPIATVPLAATPPVAAPPVITILKASHTITAATTATPLATTITTCVASSETSMSVSTLPNAFPDKGALYTFARRYTKAVDLGVVITVLIAGQASNAIKTTANLALKGTGLAISTTLVPLSIGKAVVGVVSEYRKHGIIRNSVNWATGVSNYKQAWDAFNFLGTVKTETQTTTQTTVELRKGNPETNICETTQNVLRTQTNFSLRQRVQAATPHLKVGVIKNVIPLVYAAGGVSTVSGSEPVFFSLEKAAQVGFQLTNTTLCALNTGVHTTLSTLNTGVQAINEYVIPNLPAAETVIRTAEETFETVKEVANNMKEAATSGLNTAINVIKEPNTPYIAGIFGGLYVAANGYQQFKDAEGDARISKLFGGGVKMLGGIGAVAYSCLQIYGNSFKAIN
ncbi:MAG: hypothetical protein WCF65_07695 [Parachlamydiaceae bacterium]